MLMLYIISIITLALMATMFIIILFFGLLSRLANWLEPRYGAKVRQLTGFNESLPNIGNTSKDTRDNSKATKIEIYCIYCFEKGYEFIKTRIRRISDFIHNFVREHIIHAKRDYQNNNSRNKDSKTNIKDFSHFAPTIRANHLPSSHSSMLNGFKIGGKQMTKPNDLTSKIGLFAIGLGIGSFLTLARTQPTLPTELRISLVSVSIAALFVGLFSLRTRKNY